jgi:hypothetical protein
MKTETPFTPKDQPPWPLPTEVQSFHFFNPFTAVPIPSFTCFKHRNIWKAKPYDNVEATVKEHGTGFCG